MTLRDRISLTFPRCAQWLGSSTGALLMTGAFFLLMWGRFFASLAGEWQLDPQYAHGWFIPVLAGILAWGRQRHCPARAGATGPWAAWASLLVLAPVIPLAFLEAVYPEARPFHWFHAVVVALVTFAWLWAYGGWSWVKHFAFPVLFVLLAVPWPRAFQNNITNRLMYDVAGVSVELVSLLGIAAWQQGNTIALIGGVVGVDEACSGIRSLQGSIMVGLFLGEWLGLNRLARVALLVISVGLALALNVIRASFLTWVCSTSGTTGLQSYHDPAGLIILVTVFAASLGIAKVLGHFFQAPLKAEVPSAGAALVRPEKFFRAALVGIVMLIFTDLACSLYFRSAPSGASAGLMWDLDFKRAPGKITSLPIGETARQFLRYDSGQSKRIDSPEGAISLIELRWKGGEISAAGARLHNPLVCLPSIGYKLIDILPRVDLVVSGVDCSFDAARFDVNGRPAYVYHAVWEAGQPVRNIDGGDQSLRSAFRAVWARRRLAQARVLLIMFVGPHTTEEGQSGLETLLSQVVRLSGTEP